MRPFKNKFVSVLLILLFSLGSVVLASCEEEEKDNSGLLLLLFAASQQNATDSYLLSVPPGVAKD